MKTVIGNKQQAVFPLNVLAALAPLGCPQPGGDDSKPARTSTPAAEITSISQIPGAPQQRVEFTLTGIHDGEWKVYAANTGGAVLSTVSADFSGGTLSLIAAGGELAPGTYYVSVTEKGKTESGRLGLTLTPYTPVRIGLLTDPHYADINPAGSRHFKDALNKVRDAVAYFNTAPLDFIAELGDLKDKHATDKLFTVGCLGTIEGELRKAYAEVAHVLGNHDMDMLSKAEFLEHITNPSRAVYPDNAVDKSYYSFVVRGIKFIVLDACFTKNNDPYKGDASGTNYTYREASVPPKEQQWLRMELDSPYPVIILAHQLLDFWNKPAADPDTVVLNANEVVEILEASGKVAAVFQGHHHAGHYSTRKGIHYVTLKGMVEGPYSSSSSSTSYAVAEIDASLNITWDGFGNEPDRNLVHPAP